MACDAVVDVELGRDIGSRVGRGNEFAAPSSMTNRIGGRDGEDIRVGMGAAIGGRAFTRSVANVEAVMESEVSRENSRL
jgi:hypothetical protein